MNVTVLGGFEIEIMIHISVDDFLQQFLQNDMKPPRVCPA